MHDAILSTGSESLLVAAPFVLLLLIGLFRLDQVFTTGKRQGNRRQTPRGLDETGEPIFSDPDGAVAKKRISRG
jgi:hypothetical protein